MIRHSDYKWLLMALAAIAVLTPALTCVAPRIMGTFFIAFGLLGMIADSVSKKRWPDFDWKLTLFACALLGYGALSIFWSINPDDTAGKTVQLTSVFITLAFLKGRIDQFNAQDLNFLGRMLLIGASAGIAVYYFEWFNNFPIYEMTHPGNFDVQDNKQNKAIVTITLLASAAFPFVRTMRNNALYAFYAALLAFIGCATWYSPSDSAIKIMQVMPILIAVIWAFPFRRVMIAATVAGAITMSFAMLPASRAIALNTDFYNSDLPSSIKSRLEMWDQVARRILERPVLGWGLDSSPSLPNRGELLISSDDNEPWAPPREIAHLHPHNAPLQIWFELGLPGMALLSALLAMCGFGLAQIRDKAAYVFGTVFFVQMFLFTLSIWGIWQTWFLATLCFMGLMAHAGIKRLDA